MRRLAAQLSQAFNPVALGLERLHVGIRHQLDWAGVPYDWQGPLLSLGWALVLFMVVRSLSGWLRLVVMVFAVLVLGKVYGVLPGA